MKILVKITLMSLLTAASFAIAAEQQKRQYFKVYASATPSFTDQNQGTQAIPSTHIDGSNKTIEASLTPDQLRALRYQELQRQKQIDAIEALIRLKLASSANQ